MGFGSFNPNRKSVNRKDRVKKSSPGPSGKARHRVRIDTYEAMETREHGQVPKVVFRVVESQVEMRGAETGDTWWINGAGLQGDYEWGDCQAFIRQVIASLGGDPQCKVEDVFKTMNDAAAPGQPLRGLDLWQTTVAAKTGKGMDVINASYEPIPQTFDDVKRQRAELDDWKRGVGVSAAPAAAAAASAPVTGTAAAPPPPAPEVASTGTSLLGGLL